MSFSNPEHLSRSKFFSHFSTLVHSLVSARLSSISLTHGLPSQSFLFSSVACTSWDVGYHPGCRMGGPIALCDGTIARHERFRYALFITF